MNAHALFIVVVVDDDDVCVCLTGGENGACKVVLSGMGVGEFERDSPSTEVFFSLLRIFFVTLYTPYHQLHMQKAIRVESAKQSKL
jgi:hypothetical protein